MTRARCLAPLGLAARGAVAPWMVVVALGLAVTGRAQSTRAELIARQQADRQERLEIEGPDRVERLMRRVLSSPLLAASGGPYPWFGSVYQNTGTAIGAGYLKRMPYRSRLDVLAAVTIAGSSTFGIRASLPEPARGRFAFNFDARYTDAKDLSFFGLGPDSGSEETLEYDIRPATLGATASFRPSPWLELSGEVRRLSVTTERLSSSPPRDAPGLGLSLSYNVIRTSAAVDWRSSPRYSARGGYYRVSFARFDERRDEPHSFDSLESEVVQLVPLVREQFVLAFRSLVTVTRTAEGERVPFFLSPFLGSGETLRGFDTWRFTDRHRLLLTGEYRWRASRFLDMALFVDAGKVAARAVDLNLSGLETSWGIGARFHGPTFTALRAELAKSRDGWRVIVSARQAF